MVQRLSMYYTFSESSLCKDYAFFLPFEKMSVRSGDLSRFQIRNEMCFNCKKIIFLDVFELRF